jgi:hypothetical protein
MGSDEVLSAALKRFVVLSVQARQLANDSYRRSFQKGNSNLHTSRCTV